MENETSNIKKVADAINNGSEKCDGTNRDSKTEVYNVFGGRRVVMSFRCSEELKRAFVPVAKHFFGSVCRPFEAFMATILTAVNEHVNFDHTVRIEKLVVERNLRPRRYSRGSSYGEPEVNMYDPCLCDWVFVSDAVLNCYGHAVGCGCKVCSGGSPAWEMGETAGNAQKRS